MMKWLERVIAPAIVALLVAGVANGAVWQWSHTAGTNASVDPTINWAEGMAPSSVNDSARAMMARIADWRDDMNGNVLTGGTSTAITVTSNSSVSNPPPNTFTIAFIPPATNAAGVTLAVDGGTAYPINESLNVALPAGVLASGRLYTFAFCAASACGSNQWFVRDKFVSAGDVPIGTVLDYTGATPPNTNYVLANGQCISRTTYATYFAIVGTAYGGCDGVNNFAVPDLSNRVVAGTQMSGTARITAAGGNFDGSVLGNAGGAQNHTLTKAELPTDAPTGAVGVSGGITFSSSGTNSYQPAGSVTRPAVTVTGGTNTVDSTGATLNLNLSGAAGSTKTITAALAADPVFTGTAITATWGSTSTSFTGDPLGSGNAHSILSPTMVLTKIVRVR